MNIIFKLKELFKFEFRQEQKQTGVLVQQQSINSESEINFNRISINEDPNVKNRQQ